MRSPNSGGRYSKAALFNSRPLFEQDSRQGAYDPARAEQLPGSRIFSTVQSNTKKIVSSPCLGVHRLASDAWLDLRLSHRTRGQEQGYSCGRTDNRARLLRRVAPSNDSKTTYRLTALQSCP